MINSEKTCLEKLIKLSTSVSKYCVGMEGNVSGKYLDLFKIKASGAKLNEITKNDFVSFDFDGNQIDNFDKKGSMELSFHTFLLSFEGINYISHTHPINTLKILCTKHAYSFANYRLFPDQVVFNGVKSCLVPYGKPGEDLTVLIKDHVNRFIEEEDYFPKLILLQNHGIIMCGSTIDECIIGSEICEKSAMAFIGGINLGNIQFLKENEIKDLSTDDKEKYRKSLL